MIHSRLAVHLVAAALVLTAASLGKTRNALADAEPFVGEIAATGNGFCPRGWAEAAGQVLAISANDALFSLYGTAYGGNGITTFALPDLRGRSPVGVGTGNGLSPRPLGSNAGQQSVELGINQLALHNHTVGATNSDGNFPGPGGKILAAAPAGGSGAETIYSELPPNRTMSPLMISNTGASAPVDTLDPTLVVRYCVALVGIYPSRN
jgi:microcystin-dependent protein